MQNGLLDIRNIVVNAILCKTSVLQKLYFVREGKRDSCQTLCANNNNGRSIQGDSLKIRSGYILKTTHAIALRKCIRDID